MFEKKQQRLHYLIHTNYNVHLYISAVGSLDKNPISNRFDSNSIVTIYSHQQARVKMATETSLTTPVTASMESKPSPTLSTLSSAKGTVCCKVCQEKFVKLVLLSKHYKEFHCPSINKNPSAPVASSARSAMLTTSTTATSGEKTSEVSTDMTTNLSSIKILVSDASSLSKEVLVSTEASFPEDFGTKPKMEELANVVKDLAATETPLIKGESFIVLPETHKASQPKSNENILQEDQKTFKAKSSRSQSALKLAKQKKKNDIETFVVPLTTNNNETLQKTAPKNLMIDSLASVNQVLKATSLRNIRRQLNKRQNKGEQLLVNTKRGRRTTNSNAKTETHKEVIKATDEEKGNKELELTCLKRSPKQEQEADQQVVHKKQVVEQEDERQEQQQLENPEQPKEQVGQLQQLQVDECEKQQEVETHQQHTSVRVQAERGEGLIPQEDIEQQLEPQLQVTINKQVDARNVGTPKMRRRPRQCNKTAPAIINSDSHLSSMDKPKKRNRTKATTTASEPPLATKASRPRGRPRKCPNFDSSVSESIALAPVEPTTEMKKRQRRKPAKMELDQTYIVEPQKKRTRHSAKSIQQENQAEPVLNANLIQDKAAAAKEEQELTSQPCTETPAKRNARKTPERKLEQIAKAKVEKGNNSVSEHTDQCDLISAPKNETVDQAETGNKSLEITQPEKPKSRVRQKCTPKAAERPAKQVAQKPARCIPKKPAHMKMVKAKRHQEVSDKSAERVEPQSDKLVPEHNGLKPVATLQEAVKMDELKMPAEFAEQKPDTKTEQHQPIILLQPSFKKTQTVVTVMAKERTLVSNKISQEDNSGFTQIMQNGRYPNLTITKMPTPVAAPITAAAGGKEKYQRQIKTKSNNDRDLKVQSSFVKEEDCAGEKSDDSDIELLHEEISPNLSRISMQFTGSRIKPNVMTRTLGKGSNYYRISSNNTILRQFDEDSDNFSTDGDSDDMCDDETEIEDSDEEYSHLEEEDFDRGVDVDVDNDELKIVYTGLDAGQGNSVRFQTCKILKDSIDIFETTSSTKKSSKPSSVGFHYGKQDVLGNSFEFFQATHKKDLDVLMEELVFNDDDEMFFPTEGPYLCEVCQTFVQTNAEYFHHLQLHLDVVDPEILERMENYLENESVQQMIVIE